MFILLSLIDRVGAFDIVSTLVMLVPDKQADIAILRTLGLTPRGVMQVFMVQGTLIGVVGTVLGVIGGVVLALNLDTSCRPSRTCSACSSCPRTSTTSAAADRAADAGRGRDHRAGVAGAWLSLATLYPGLARRAHGSGGGAAL